ncbi:hypothetical protein ABZ712_32220 [Streptomyces sp. NPDC006906]
MPSSPSRTSWTIDSIAGVIASTRRRVSAAAMGDLSWRWSSP